MLAGFTRCDLKGCIALNSGRGLGSFFGLEQLEYASGEESLQAAFDLPVCLTFGTPTLDVASDLFVAGAPNEDRAVCGKVVAYTGDGEFGEEIAKVGQDADLLIAECYFHEKPVPWHLNYPELVANKAAFGAKRIVLTHMSKEMLAVVDEIPEECAHDGMVVEI